MKKTYRIDVHLRKRGYAMAVSTFGDAEDALEGALKAKLFEDPDDAIISTVEEITDDEYEMERWSKYAHDLDAA